MSENYKPEITPVIAFDCDDCGDICCVSSGRQPSALLVRGVPMVGERVEYRGAAATVLGHGCYVVLEDDETGMEDEIDAAELSPVCDEDEDEPAPDEDEAIVERVAEMLRGATKSLRTNVEVAKDIVATVLRMKDKG